jgi:N-acetylglutamate synthase
MHINDFAASLTGVFQEMTPLIAGARFFREEGAVAVVSGIPTPNLNGVFLERANPSAAAVAALLDKVAAADVPHSLHLWSESDNLLSDLAARRDMVREDPVPAMVLDGTVVARTPSPAGLAIRQLSPEEGFLHAHVAAAAFEIPGDYFQRLLNPDVLGLDSVRCYVGELDGQPVTTGVGYTLGGSTGIFDIATLPGFRGRGFGRAITARAVADGLAAGASWCWLQSSAMGYHVYRSLGFREIDSWPCWISAA